MIETAGNQLGNKSEADFVGTQKKLEAKFFWKCFNYIFRLQQLF